MNIESSSQASAAPPPPMPRRRKHRTHWMIWVVLGISLMVNISTCSNIGGGRLTAGSEQYPVVEETLVWGEGFADVKVAEIALEGVIMRDSPATLFGEVVDPVTKILNEIRAATVDSDYRAILLEVNSPGGGVTASDEIYEALMAFKAGDPERKIVVHIRDMAASGGYYVALAGDLLVAQPTSVVGSVGVMISALNMHQLSEKVGIEDVSLTSSGNKALLSTFEPVEPVHREILQQVVDQMYERFRALVLDHRPFDETFAAEHKLLDGRVFSQSAALGFGLVDESGYLVDSRARTLSLLGVAEAGFYSVEHSGGGWGSLFAVKSPEVFNSLKPASGFQYLWKP